MHGMTDISGVTALRLIKTGFGFAVNAVFNRGLRGSNGLPVRI